MLVVFYILPTALDAEWEKLQNDLGFLGGSVPVANILPS
jgi:hypothetical protein